MMRKLLTSLIFLAAAYFPARPADTLPAGWEPVKTENTASSKTVMKDAEIEIRTEPTAIVVASAHPVQIKVFTILGRIVSEAGLPAGTSRFNMPAHGVYIIKAGTLTCKVAL